MISRRLTKTQKDEILEAYRGGENTNILAEKFSCSSNTINRTVKTLLTDADYKSLKEQRLRSSKKKVQELNNNSFDSKEEESTKNAKDFYNYQSDEILVLPMGELSNSEFPDNKYSDAEITNQNAENQFAEIVPLASNLDLENKELSFEIHNQAILPESVFMLVDKKVELEIKSISDFPEWSFLPENELKRNAIQLFSNQRTAKRICSRNQRVIKVPNTSVFEVTKSYLLLKGITRLILEDSIIALDG